jgi:ABC-type glucose/galactose transport system permease subunit
MADTGQLTEEQAVTMRKRVEYEDQLLNSRTGIVLTLNGLMAVAASLSLPVAARIVTATVIIIVNTLWIICSLDAQHYIHGLSARINESGLAPIDEKIRKELQSGRFRIGSTRFMSLFIPALLLAGWLLGLLVSICNQ